jgi:hypothetical protein
MRRTAFSSREGFAWCRGAAHLASAFMRVFDGLAVHCGAGTHTSGQAAIGPDRLAGLAQHPGRDPLRSANGRHG